MLKVKQVVFFSSVGLMLESLKDAKSLPIPKVIYAYPEVKAELATMCSKAEIGHMELRRTVDDLDVFAILEGMRVDNVLKPTIKPSDVESDSTRVVMDGTGFYIYTFDGV